jgi:hypothetical protein
MTEPEINCPHCHRRIELTETLAGPLLARVRAGHETELRELREQVTREQAEAARRAAAAQVQQLQQELAERRAKLQELERNELALRRSKQALEERQAALELEVQRQLDTERARIRDEAQRQFVESQRLKDAEKDKVIGDLRRQIEELQRRADQGSQQLKGEVQELDLEARLRAAFPGDTIQEVPKGVSGADCIQRVLGGHGAAAGAILWESKRTRNWSEPWLAKLRHDQRALRAELAVLVSDALPRNGAPFTCLDGVWVTEPACAIPLAAALREGLLALAQARTALSGQQTKMQVLYEYLVGPQFRQRVEAVVEAFTTMRIDLEKEKVATQRVWARREKQFDRVLTGMSGMYGDLQGIAGASLPELPSLSLDATPLVEGEAAAG